MKRKPVKRIFQLLHLLSILGLVLTTSCTHASTASPTSVSNSPRPPDESTTPTHTVNADNVTITFAVDLYNLELYKPLAKAFNQQNPTIKVLLVPIEGSPNPSDWAGLAAAADAAVLTDGMVINRDNGSYFLDLQPLIDATPDFTPSEFWPGVLSSCQDEDSRTIGLPLGVRLQGIFYDEKAFAAAGLSSPKPGWTWEEFRQDVKQLAGSQGDIPHYGFADGLDLSASILTPLVDASLAANNYDIASESLAADLQWYFNLVKDKSLYSLLFTPAAEIYMKRQTDLRQSPPPMWVNGLGSWNLWGSSGLDMDTYGFIPFPVSSNPPNDRTAIVTPNCAAISSGSRHPQAAWTWLEFLSHHWIQMKSMAPWEEIPARSSVAESVGYWNILPPKAVQAVRFAMTHIDAVYHNTVAYVAIGNAFKANPTGSLQDSLTEAQKALATSPITKRHDVTVTVASPPDWAENVTVIRWLGGSMTGTGEIQVEEALLAQYSRSHPGVFFVSPASTYYFNDMVSASDCGRNYPPYPWTAQDAANFLDLTPWVDQEGSSFKADYDPSLLDRFRYEGDLYGLPSESIPYVVYYNADLLKSLGIQPPSAGWTFNDLTSLASQVAASDPQGKRYGLVNPIGTLLLIGHGENGLDATTNPPVVTLDSPTMVNALHWMAGLKKDHVLYSTENYFSQDLAKAFYAGEVGFWISSVGDPKFYMTYVPGSDPIDYQIGAAPLPLMNDGKAISFIMRTPGYYITNNTTNAQACWDVIKFLSSSPNVYSGIPARISAAASPMWETAVGREYAPVYRQELERELHAPISIYDYNQIWSPLFVWRDRALDSALNAGIDPKQALSEAQTKAKSYVACVMGLGIDTTYNQPMNDGTKTCAKQVDPDGHW